MVKAAPKFGEVLEQTALPGFDPTGVYRGNSAKLLEWPP
jgi:hypothetical protein